MHSATEISHACHGPKTVVVRAPLSARNPLRGRSDVEAHLQQLLLKLRR
jgi:hypothetical protein